MKKYVNINQQLKKKISFSIRAFLKNKLKTFCMGKKHIKIEKII